MCHWRPSMTFWAISPNPPWIFVFRRFTWIYEDFEIIEDQRFKYSRNSRYDMVVSELLLWCSRNRTWCKSKKMHFPDNISCHLKIILKLVQSTIRIQLLDSQICNQEWGYLVMKRSDASFLVIMRTCYLKIFMIDFLPFKIVMWPT